MDENPYKPPLSDLPPLAKDDALSLTTIQFRSPSMAFFAAVPLTAITAAIVVSFNGMGSHAIAVFGALIGIYAGLLAAALTGLSLIKQQVEMPRPASWASRLTSRVLRIVVAAVVVFVVAVLLQMTFLAAALMVATAVIPIAGIVSIVIEVGLALRRAVKANPRVTT